MGLDECLLPITFPVTVGLGEDMAGALNALASVPRQAAGGAFALEAYRFARATSVFDGSLFSRASVNSHDLISVFKAMVDIELW